MAGHLKLEYKGKKTSIIFLFDGSFTSISNLKCTNKRQPLLKSCKENKDKTSWGSEKIFNGMNQRTRNRQSIKRCELKCPEQGQMMGGGIYKLVTLRKLEEACFWVAFFVFCFCTSTQHEMEELCIYIHPYNSQRVLRETDFTRTI